MNEDLLIKYLNKECSPAELHSIFEWTNQSANNRKWLFEMEKAWSAKAFLRYSDKKKLDIAYQKFIVSINPKKHKTKSFNWIFALQMAASITLILLFGIDILNRTKKTEPTSNTIEVPAGQRVAVTLSDQTKVWLNAETKFTYPSSFSKHNRNVFLEGEAFFKVAHNKEKPFTVHTDKIDVKVLGTVFNLNAYPKVRTAVTLNQGKVEISANHFTRKVILNPDQQAICLEKDLYVRKNVNSSLARLWIDGELAYLDEPLKVIAKGLERQFSVVIVIENESLSNKLFTCRFKPGITLHHALNLLKTTREMDYELHNNYIKFYKPTKKSNQMKKKT